MASGRVSKRAILREAGMHWKTLKKVLTHSEPPGYRLRKDRPKQKLGPYQERIEQILKEDQLKAAHKISFADAFVAATALRWDAALVHKDSEFKALDGVIKLLALPLKESVATKAK